MMRFLFIVAYLRWRLRTPMRGAPKPLSNRRATKTPQRRQIAAHSHQPNPEDLPRFLQGFSGKSAGKTDGSAVGASLRGGNTPEAGEWNAPEMGAQPLTAVPTSPVESAASPCWQSVACQEHRPPVGPNKAQAWQLPLPS